MATELEGRADLLPVQVERLEQGMYVGALDRPWLETPFAVQGFFVLHKGDIEMLARYCRRVYVDPRRYEPLERLGARRLSPEALPGWYEAGPGQPRSMAARKPARPPGPVQGRKRYRDTVSMRDEFASAKKELSTVNEVVARVFERLRDGKSVDMAALTRVINPLIDSILRNKDALSALIRVKKKDSYTYSHSISTSVWATVLGRHLGLDRATLRMIGLASLLLDIGKVALPRELLVKRGELTRAERSLVQRHVEESLRILEASGIADERVLQIVAAHHERHDGSGYPRGLAGGEIPLGARIAGLADAYDAMITHRPYAEARSSYQAMQELTRKSDIEFQGELVEQLMQAIGLFPTGSLVELDTGEVAIVVAQNPSRRLKPRVVLVLDAEKQPLGELVSLDLLAAEQQGANSASKRVVRELPPGSDGIDAERYYL